ncbi:LOW QUALITY PROTEIN: sperm protein associated with the nucleus on the X chromosome N2-like [Saimiri boliviensis]|uniref:LOW QUALITY PROTEIN: sperm protein associated with the nucleus on the X chromosome N2-like n=1 Tax=Saimiri boliviensis TaxID=27679 RepID=UPI003D783BF2
MFFSRAFDHLLTQETLDRVLASKQSLKKPKKKKSEYLTILVFYYRKDKKINSNQLENDQSRENSMDPIQEEEDENLDSSKGSSQEDEDLDSREGSSQEEEDMDSSEGSSQEEEDMDSSEGSSQDSGKD